MALNIRVHRDGRVSVRRIDTSGLANASWWQALGRCGESGAVGRSQELDAGLDGVVKWEDIDGEEHQVDTHLQSFPWLSLGDAFAHREGQPSPGALEQARERHEQVMKGVGTLLSPRTPPPKETGAVEPKSIAFTNSQLTDENEQQQGDGNDHGVEQDKSDDTSFSGVETTTSITGSRIGTQFDTSRARNNNIYAAALADSQASMYLERLKDVRKNAHPKQETSIKANGHHSEEILFTLEHLVKETETELVLSLNDMHDAQALMNEFGIRLSDSKETQLQQLFEAIKSTRFSHTFANRKRSYYDTFAAVNPRVSLQTKNEIIDSYLAALDERHLLVELQRDSVRSITRIMRQKIKTKSEKLAQYYTV
mmetsp:Transcript_23671/g.37784  ORF Transcript_23671/g.37784 Transcript_23671/m.37784 type:complete len:367 (-) Transcript_23671:659-1759(-)